MKDLIRRIKNLWRMSDIDFTSIEKDKSAIQLFNKLNNYIKPKGMATIVQDNPLDVFPNHEENI